MSYRDPVDVPEPSPPDTATLLEAVMTCDFALPGGGALTEDVALSLIVAGRIAVDDVVCRNPGALFDWPRNPSSATFSPKRTIRIGTQWARIMVRGDIATIESQPGKYTNIRIGQRLHGRPAPVPTARDGGHY